MMGGEEQAAAVADEDVAVGLEDIQRRLRRLEGQVRGLQRMISERRDCTDIITQFLAARAALDEIGARVLDAELQRCLPKGTPGSERVAKMLRLWLRVGGH